MEDNRKTILITGCSPGGIGNALAREFHSRGFRVFATARSKSSLEDLSSIGIDALDLEVTSPESVEKCKADISAITGGKLDYLVNNAGQNYTVPALDISLPEVLAVFQTNVIAPMHIIQVFSPLLISSRGTIVQIASIAAVFPFAFGSVYNGSKAALLAYSNTLRVELAPFGVKVVSVMAGGVQSRIARTKRALGLHSLYTPIDDFYQERVGYSQAGAMEAPVFAKRVVDRLLGMDSWVSWLLMRNKKLIWEGNLAKVVWFAYSFMWEGFFDPLMKKRFGLWKLQKLMQVADKSK